MKVFEETRGQYRIKCYKIDVTPAMRAQARNFATEIVDRNDQYSRLLPQSVIESRDREMQRKVEIQRTAVGKLGELVFSEFLKEKGIPHSTEGMFAIYEGQENVDDFDFVTAANETIDVKTGFRSIHKRLLINIEQFDHIPKDYYVAVKLNAQEMSGESNLNKLIDWESITEGTIEGYAEYDYLRRCAKTRNRGEGDAREIEYTKLLGIDRLIRNM